MAGTHGPTVRRRIVASELKRLRQHAGMRQQCVAEAVGLEPSALSRYEQARTSMTTHTAQRLLEFYGVQGSHFDWLLDLVRGSRRRGLLADVKGRVWQPLEDLVALERDASTIQEMAIQVVPGLLQTEEYARSILKAGIVGSEVDLHVTSRLARAAILSPQDPVSYWVILREPVLRCNIGGPQVMRDQLQHLMNMAKNPNITLQVLPDHRGEHPAMATPFSLLRFNMAPDYGVVYLDYLTGSLYRDDPDEVATYNQAFTHLIKVASDEKESLDQIDQARKQLYS